MTEENIKPAKEKKKNKKKGPLRLEAIIPILVILVLTFLYGRYFFDSHLRKGLEWTASKVHGAEVNIGKIQSSFFKGSFSLHNLQVTDKKNPANNMVEVGEVKFQLLWDALLRAKMVVNEAKIENILVDSPRESPGEIFPIEVTDEDSPKNETVAKAEQAILDQSKEQFSDNALGDVATILEGSDPKDQASKIRGQLGAEKKIDELEQLLKTREEEWKKRINSLSQGDELKALTAKVKAIKIDKKKPWKAAKQYSKITKEIKAKIKEYKDASSNLKNDMGTFKNSIKEVEQLAKKDVADLQKRFKVPDLNLGDFSKGLFGKMFQEKVAGYKKYIDMGRKLMPPKKAAEEKAPTLVPRKRGQGKNYKFTVKGGYPLFWLKNGKISSKSSTSQFSGDLEGEIKDLTTDPIYLGKPMTVDLNGDFPHQGIKGFKANIIVDHTGDIPTESIQATVRSFPIDGQNLSKSDNVTLGLKKATGSSKLNGKMREGKLNIHLRNRFTKVDYLVEANNKNVREILTGVVNRIPIITLNARATGSWSDINWNLSSNLGKEISNGVKAEVNAKVAQAKAKIKKMVDDKVLGKKKKLEEKYAKAKEQMNKVLNKQEDKVQSTGKNALSSAKGGASSSSPKKQVKKKVGNKLKKAFKKFKF
jgi:uncharacterized protein (TIGR03545 family)